jgi:hypothetical protein
MEQFKIEVANDGQAYYFDIKPVGNNQYEIYRELEKLGTIEIDENDHEHCKTIDCELDLPLMNVIREAILAHENPQ